MDVGMPPFVSHLRAFHSASRVSRRAWQASARGFGLGPLSLSIEAHASPRRSGALRRSWRLCVSPRSGIVGMRPSIGLGHLRPATSTRSI